MGFEIDIVFCLLENVHFQLKTRYQRAAQCRGSRSDSEQEQGVVFKNNLELCCDIQTSRVSWALYFVQSPALCKTSTNHQLRSSTSLIIALALHFRRKHGFQIIIPFVLLTTSTTRISWSSSWCRAI